ncbi:tyrosine-type recombinase/integrase [Cerasicoccus fimbriatus]|uniref:tyrosine-type recombinase/integrase n=1 Tax=Cerasicoccus fimbriatus TaxID=3014554 RepID=UPI0022B37256|nr:site-specific integrase [Cerasicoccus sp. TK19100]
MNYAPNAMSVVDRHGWRKYLTHSELLRFIDAALRQPPERRLFALMLVLTGCRISEALALTTHSFDLEAGFVIIRTLKQRRRKKRSWLFQLVQFFQWVWPWTKKKKSPPKPPVYRYRWVCLHTSYLQSLQKFFDLGNANATHERLWAVDRKTAYRWIKEIMTEADISGPHAHPHAIRHTFAMIHSDEFKTPQSLLQRLMGHADSKTTEIYQQLHGQEELKYMEAMWMKLKIDKRRNFHL